MKSRVVGFLSKNYPLLVYLIVAGFSFTWFKGSDFISAGDFSWPIRFDIFFNLTKHIWDWSVAPGYNASRQVSSIFPYALYGFLAFKVGIGSALFERLLFFTSFFFSGYGFYLFAIKFVKTKSSAFLAGLLYMMTPYASIMVWNPTYGLSFPFFCYLPLSLAFLIDYCRETRLFSQQLFLSLLVTFFSFIGASYSNPVFFVQYIVLATFFVFSSSITKKLALQKTFIYFTAYILLNLFWIMPFVASIKTQYQAASNESAGIVSDKRIQFLNSVQLKDAFIETGFWAFSAGDAGDEYYVFTSVFNNKVYLMLSYISVSIIFFGIFQGNRKLKSLYLLFLLGLLINSGLLFHPPFSIPFNFIYSLPLLDRMFRSVFLKTGIIISIPIPILLMATIEDTNLRIIKKYSYVLIIILILFRSIPFLTGDVIKPAGKILPSYAFSIPSDYYQMAEYVNELPSSEYIITLPLPKSYNYIFKWKVGGYVGSDFFRTMITKSNFYVNSNNPEVAEFANTFNPYLLRRLGIKYVLLHKDVPLYFSSRFITSDFNKMYKSITLSDGLELVKETENLTLYRVKNYDVSPFIYTVADSVYKTESSSSNEIFSKLTTNQILVDESQSAPSKRIIIPQYINNSYPAVEEWNEGWAWPDVRVSPKSWQYILVKVKEWVSLTLTFDSESKIDKYIWFSAKRIKEIIEYSPDTKTVSKLNKNLSRNMSEIARLLEKISTTGNDNDINTHLSLVNKASRYIKRGLDLSANYPDETKVILSSFYDLMLDISKSFCVEKCWYFKSNFNGRAFITGIDDFSTTQLFTVVEGKLQEVQLQPDNSFVAIDGIEYLFVKKEKVENLLTSVNSIKPYFDGKTAYAFNTFTAIDRYKYSGDYEYSYKYRNPLLIEKYVDNVDPSNLYNLVIDYSKVTSQVGLLVLEQTVGLKYAQNTALIGDLHKLEDASSLNLIFNEEDITAKKLKNPAQNTYVYSKDFILSPNASALRIILFIYVPPGEVSSVQFNKLLLKSTSKEDPLISDFKFVALSPQPSFKNVIYQKINDRTFTFDLKGIDKYLVLNAGYDHGWVLKSENKVLKHFEVDGYKNGWVLPVRDRAVTYQLFYEPDKSIYLGIYISITMTVVCIIFFLRNLWKNT